MSHQRILIVEDEPRIALLLRDYLAQAGYQTHHLEDGRLVLPWLADNAVDLILLDLMLPGVRGERLCVDLRGQGFLMPVIIISAKAEEGDRVLCLELGADDYLCKPFSPREAVARVRAALRRQAYSQRVVTEPDLRLDASRLTVTLSGQSVQVTSVEFQLIKALAAEPGRILSRQSLMACLYQDHRVVHDRTVDGHVKKLRRKLVPLFGSHEALQSVYGAGYRFAPRDSGNVADSAPVPADDV